MIDLGDLMNTKYRVNAANIEKEHMLLELASDNHEATCNLTHAQAKILQHNCEEIIISLRTYLNAHKYPL